MKFDISIFRSVFSIARFLKSKTRNSSSIYLPGNNVARAKGVARPTTPACLRWPGFSSSITPRTGGTGRPIKLPAARTLRLTRIRTPRCRSTAGCTASPHAALTLPLLPRALGRSREVNTNSRLTPRPSAGLTSSNFFAHKNNRPQLTLAPQLTYGQIQSHKFSGRGVGL